MRANCEWDILLPCNYSVHWTSPCSQCHITKMLDLSSIQVMDVPALPKLEYQIQRKTNNSIIQEKYCHPTRNGGVFPHRFLWIENREFLQNFISQSIWQKLGGNRLLFLFPAPRGFLQRWVIQDTTKTTGYGRKWRAFPQHWPSSENNMTTILSNKKPVVKLTFEVENAEESRVFLFWTLSLQRHWA